MERVISDECLDDIKRQCWDAGLHGRDRHTVREPDGPEVVRCRDCAHAERNGCSLHELFWSSDWDGSGFCAWGERRTDDGD